MYKVILPRDIFFDQQASLGTCFVYNGKQQLFKSESLERGWVNNRNRISCIPTGIYHLVLEYSPRFKKDLWEIKGVPGRSECKIHQANYWFELNGCIALGANRKDIDGDLVMDVTSSRETVNAFERALQGQKEVEIHIFNLWEL